MFMVFRECLEVLIVCTGNGKIVQCHGKHAFYGMAGANNDINVLDNSPLFDDLLDDLAPVVPYVRQESARKDVERAFGVLQGRWGLIQQPARAYEVNTLRRIMYAGIIMHNMILEDQNMSVVDFKHVYSNPASEVERASEEISRRRNPLDLNNFPDDFTKDQSKQPLDDSSSSASGIYRKKKNGAKDESGKVYECRFCSLKFCKSQALGGHMNRHRQERETETLNRARQLVFSNDNLIPQLPHQLGGQPVLHGGFHHQGMLQTLVVHFTLQTLLRDFHHHFTTRHICSTGNPPPDSTNNYTCIGAPVVQSFTFGGGSGASGRNMSTSTVNRYHE
ncbi:zinc finger protein JAGGED-like protein [Tanacetum coccineum]